MAKFSFSSAETENTSETGNVRPLVPGDALHNFQAGKEYVEKTIGKMYLDLQNTSPRVQEIISTYNDPEKQNEFYGTGNRHNLREEGVKTINIDPEFEGTFTETLNSFALLAIPLEKDGEYAIVPNPRHNFSTKEKNTSDRVFNQSLPKVFGVDNSIYDEKFIKVRSLKTPAYARLINGKLMLHTTGNVEVQQAHA